MEAHKKKSKIYELVELLGKSVIESINGLGSYANFIMKFFYWLMKPPYRLGLFWEQMYFIGNKSIFIILLSGSFTGMVFAYQTYFGIQLINVDTIVGPSKA